MLIIKLSQNQDTALTKEHLNLAHYFFLLFWLLKPFYFAPSGNAQISDFIFIISFVFWIINNRGNVELVNGNVYFLYFLICAFSINSIYFLFYKDSKLILSSLYYLYNFLVIIVICDFMKNNKFLKTLLYITYFNVLIQFGLYVLGYGRMLDDIRYMGTLNDPNQFSFYIFTSFLLIYVILFRLRNLNITVPIKSNYFIAAIIIFLIVQSSSTAMLLGIVAFLISIVLTFFLKENSPLFMLLKLALIMIVVIVSSIFIYLIAFPQMIKYFPAASNFLVMRVYDKVNLLNTGGWEAMLADRIITRIFKYPYYLFFGAGEGAYNRFIETRGFEIHSTLISITFSYGLLPLSMLLVWIRSKLRNLPKTLLPVYIGLFIESFFLANHRQPIVWMIIVLGSSYYLMDNKENDKLKIVPSNIL